MVSENMKDVSKSAYSTLKIFAHPEVVKELNEFRMVAPRLVHMMWQNLCNHNCEFCAYRRTGNKNNNMFDDTEFIPKDKMIETLISLKKIGTKAIEITGGGEPTIYPFFKEGIEKIVELGFDIGIVSNGSKFKEEWMKIMSKNLCWARISIDSGRKEDYIRIRETTESHWHKAWETVSNLRKHGSHPDFTLGVGYVVTWDNYLGISEGIRLAKENGAHNIRIAAAFTEKGLDYYSLGSVGVKLEDMIKKTSNDIQEAIAKYQDENFKVFNLFDERIGNISEGVQDYNFCMAKEVVCVVGGDQKVYTCCSLAFHPNGLVGDISDKSFEDLWFSESNRKFFFNHDPRKLCKISCLYEKRNKEFLEHRHSGLILPENTKHKNFI